MFAVGYTIEYLLAIGRAQGSVVITTPRISTSDILGGVSYVECEAHAESLVQALTRAVAKAKDLPMTSANHQEAPFKLLIRASRLVTSTTLFGWRKQEDKRIIMEWQIKLVKTKTEVSQLVGVTTSSSSAAALSSSNTNTSFSQTSLNAGGATSAARMSMLLDPATSDNAAATMLTVYSNEPSEIRELLHFVQDKVLTIIDTAWYKEIRASDIFYEVEVVGR